jgi:hypothetical protein
MLKAARAALIRAFARIERPAAWLLLGGSVVTFIGVLVGVIVVGEFRWPTLLLAAGLAVDGFQAVQEAEEDDEGG